ncbi:3-phosphoshikimate 1-carboxyvinyltransferase [Pseudothermotoga thermarum]|uniref:3-phosphoshikimate 1-carboxyvinyltransferase n=1 Tax=Pseudothermotoga thermarum DSM 5069 TaxID=688269 RepID=F7YWZ2_9THEM|nr:3-phosphoshikimate 1-carboxyvinyltransferase [Pseudothermotoga thermarum]AEH50584.1 3-phosphoshikimate 1-carboxyvinyltransferase [Pseudothermotoga thermarum DSM 5069]
MDIFVEGKVRVDGQIIPPPDKSISHRSIMIGSIAEGTTVVRKFLFADDCLRTVDCFRKMGVEIEFKDQDTVIVKGKGLRGLKKPETELYAGNSGTTMRLLLGILAGQNFEAVLTGDESLSKRPMKRVVQPLRMMGAKIEGKDDGNYAPLIVRGGQLKGISYSLPVASAQVKSALLFAGLYADGETVIYEKPKTRDHTEIMLKHFGANVVMGDGFVKITPAEKLSASQITVPGDISSAAFFMVAAAINEGSQLLIRDVGINPTRTGIIDILKQMGCDIKIMDERIWGGEKVADILIKGGRLRGITIEREIVPRLIDEIPIIAVACTFAEGQSVVKDAKELRVKESDRIKAIVYNLRNLGAEVEELEDGFVITGGKPLKPAELDSFNDHRIAMAMAVAAISIDGRSKIKNADCVAISFPNFFQMLKSVCKQI